MRVVSSGVTDVGVKRTENQDCYVCSDNLGLYVVADGMGGHAAGEVASAAAVDAILDFVRRYREGDETTWPYGLNSKLNQPENAMVNAILTANENLCVLAGKNESYKGMGTTIAGLLLYGKDKAVLAHVGDSRAYRLRDGKFEQLTQDHSWVNEQLQRKAITEEEARNHRWRNVITRALGSKLDLEIDATSVDMRVGDVYVLCSDGLYGMVDDEDVRHVIDAHGHDLDRSCESLVEQSNENGGIDNISVILVRVEETD